MNNDMLANHCSSTNKALCTNNSIISNSCIMLNNNASSYIHVRRNNGSFSTALRTQMWQTLQDNANPSNRITPPFDRVPQFTAKWQRTNVRGFDVSLDGDLTRFESARDVECTQIGSYTCAPNATRAVSSAQLSHPMLLSGGYVTPKVQVTGRNYQFDNALASTGQASANVTVPTLSLDSGITFERQTQLFGRGWTQTLEPRAFYVYTPYRDQNYLPNYDSGSNAYNFASIFSENTFGG